MEFREAKAVIREALRKAPDAKLIEILEAAREGRMPWLGVASMPIERAMVEPWEDLPKICGCLGQRIEECASFDEAISSAYRALRYSNGNVGDPDNVKTDPHRQRIVIPMVLAEIRRRNRAALGEPAATKEEIHV